jgi:probable HAF family extracellular repeat protein
MKRLIGGLILVSVLLAGCEQITEPARTDVPATGGPLFTMETGTCDQFQVPGSMSASFSLSGVTLVTGSYSFPTAIGDFGSTAYAINNAETVAGYVTESGTFRAAFKVEGSATWQPVGPLPTGTGAYSIAHAINNNGQIAGVYAAPGSAPKPFLFSGGTFILLPLPDGYSAGTAWGINDYGQVAGFVEAGTTARPFLWTPTTPNGTAFDGTLLNTAAAAAYGMNSRGDVVGQITGGGAFLWTAHTPNSTTGTWTSIGAPAGFTTAQARDINDNGEVVGFGSRSGINTAFFWKNGSFVVIEPFAGGTRSEAYAINNNGMVTGRANGVINGTTINLETFAWDAAGDRVLQHLGKAQFADACGSRGFGINDCGIIVGNSLQNGTNATKPTQWGYCEAPPSGKIGDFVWEDLNGNGVQDAGEPAISGVQVELLDGTGTVIRTTTTSSSGLYLFTELAAGNYSVRFTAPTGYVFTTRDQGGNDALDSDADPITGRTATYTLASGETNLTIDAGLVRPAGAVLLIIDEDGIDNGLHVNKNGGLTGLITPSGPQFWTDKEVNDDIAAYGLRNVLRYFAGNHGRSITVRTGQTGDEGWFAPNCIPQKWLNSAQSKTNNTCLEGANRDLAVNNYFFSGKTPFVGAPSSWNLPQDRLDKVPHVLPLRARGLVSLEGKDVCALVYDSDISINYDHDKPLGVNGNLQGATLGIAAFRVNKVITLDKFSSSTLPQVNITILDASVACKNFQLFNAPVPNSSSEPNDRVVENLAGLGSKLYRSFKVWSTKELFY